MDADRIHDLTAGLLLGAAEFIAQARVDETARGWLVRAGRLLDDTEQELAAIADALAMAMNLTLFTPSASGSTAFDRLARQRSGPAADEATVLQALRRAEFRLLRVEAPSNDGVPGFATSHPTRCWTSSMRQSGPKSAACHSSAG